MIDLRKEWRKFESNYKDYYFYGNKVLYELVKKHFFHNKKDEIISKIWLIGRSYAAAVERNSIGKKGNNIYQEVAEKIKKEEIDTKIKRIKEKRKPEDVIELHYKLVNIFEKVTGARKKTLASKYLHFHLPDVYYIYDERAKKIINKYVKQKEIKNDDDCKKILDIKIKYNEYKIFYAKSSLLNKKLNEIAKKKVLPREQDAFLLYMYELDKKIQNR